jgi:peptide/nickel transport system substrate-binding protein
MAIDRDKLVSVAHGGLATPGTTLVNPDTWVDPDWHWQPPAEQMLSFDLEKAKQTLEAAGYKDTNGDGVREGKDGKPIKLRLWASSDVPPTQSEGKLIAGWWKEIGIDVELAVVNQGTIDDAVWNYEGATYVPDYDCIVVASSGFLDPGLTLDMYTKAQIQNWNDACWWNPEYDKLAAGVSTQMDTGQRKQDIDRMQEIFYEDAPTSVLTYPKELEAYNTEDWTGWTPLMVGGQPGPVFGTSANPETYLNLKPVAQSKTSGGGGISTTTILIIVVAALVVVAVIVWLVVRRRAGKKAVEEA